MRIGSHGTKQKRDKNEEQTKKNSSSNQKIPFRVEQFIFCCCMCMICFFFFLFIVFHIGDMITLLCYLFSHKWLILSVLWTVSFGTRFLHSPFCNLYVYLKLMTSPTFVFGRSHFNKKNKRRHCFIIKTIYHMQK